MIALMIAVPLLVVVIVGLVYLLGFRLGGDHWLSELARVRMEAAQAQRRQHDVARDAFVAMSEAVERRPPR